MKKAPPVRLSLRKLFIAIFAAGPVAILPTPLLATVPQGTTAPFTTQSGTATWNGAGPTGTITASNRAVLVWGNTTPAPDPTNLPSGVAADGSTITNFNIQAGETFNFDLPSGGAVLNRVSAGNNATNAIFGGLGAAAAVINGNLISNNGAVFILANGNIIVGSGAQISTAGGLTLSTLDETNFQFTSQGNLALNGNSQGNIYLGTTGTTAVSVIGNLTAAVGMNTTPTPDVANLIAVNNLSVSGDLILNSNASGQGLVLTSAANTTVGGNFTATTNNGAISQGAGALVVSNGNTSLRITNGNESITLGTATNDFKTLTANTSASSGLGGNVTIVDANIITLGASTIGQDLNVTAAGVRDSTAIATSGALAIGGNAIFTATTENSAINIGNNTTIGSAGTFNATTNNSNITFNGVGNLTTGTINAGFASNYADPTSDSNANINITTTGVLTVGSGITNGDGNRVANITLTGSSIVQNGAVSSGNGVVTLNATAGNITTGTITANAVTLNASAGSINTAGQTGTITTDTTGTSAVRASGTINLTGANAFATGHVIQVPSASSASITNSSGLVLGTSNVTGNLTLNATAGNVVLGTASGSAAQNVTVGGVLRVDVAAGNITDNDYSAFNVTGGLNLTASGNVVLDAAVVNGSLAPSVRFGQARISGVDVSIAETTTLNLGLITATNLTARSVSGNIINSDNVNVTGTANFLTTGASTSVITNGTNSIGTVNFIGSGGALTVGAGAGVTLGANTSVTSGDDLVLTSTNSVPIIIGPATIGGSLTVNSASTITTVAGVDTTVAGQSNVTVGGNLTLIAADTGANSITDAANSRFLVNGVTTLASSGNVTLDGANDFMGGVVVNQAGSTGNILLNDINNLTVSGSSGGNLNVTAGAAVTDASIDAPWNLVLGNLNVASLNATAANAGGGVSGTITQASGTSIHSEGTFRAVTRNGNIVLTNNGNSAGRVEFFTNGGTGNGTATISYTEDGTIRVGNIAANSNVTLRSNFGSIIEDGNGTSSTTQTSFNIRATLNATAPAGSISLGGLTNNNNTTGNIAAFTASAPTGAVAIQSTGDTLTLRSVNANSLTVTASNNITQSAPLSIFGAASFTSNSASSRNITLTNNSNNFGPVSVSINNNTGSVAIAEANTLNLRRVTMLGGGNSTFTATSINGDIIDTGLGGVRLGGNASSTGSGVVTLTAAGNITIDDPTSDIATTSGVLFNAKDVTFSVLGSVGSSLTLGAASGPSQATGNLTVSSALGGINNAGSFTAGGVGSFTAPNGNILISGAGFAQLRFVGQQVSISESGNMDILTGSSSFGPANLVSGGSITIVPGSGIVTFGSTVNMTATGNILLPKLMQAAGLLTVAHTGTADLSALSIQGDLGGITPVDAGTGPYVAPNP